MTRTGRPPKHPEDRASRVLSVRLTEEEYEWLADAAKERGQSISKYVLETLCHRLTGGEFDPDEKFHK